MAQIARTALAKLDASEIWYYIAEHNETAADKIIDQVEQRLIMLAQFPESGEFMEYIRHGVRRSTVGNYVIYYTPDQNGITLLRILHTARCHEGEV